MTSKQKPCPFCGGTSNHKDGCYIPLIIQLYTEDPKKLGAGFASKLRESWNQRANDTLEPEKVVREPAKAAEPVEETVSYKHALEWLPSICAVNKDYWRGAILFCPHCGKKVEK